MTYKASWDTLTKIVTVGVTILYLGILVNLFIFNGEPTNGSRYIIGAILFLTYFITYAFRPIDYVINPEKLIIRRPFDKVAIDFKQIASAEILDDERLKWTFRTFGVGGLFGFYGKFYNSRIGSMTWYATRRKRAVLIITTGGKNIIVTPDEAASFVNQFRTVMHNDSFGRWN
ncbi:PH domain-containing protein [Dyadobacter arcticus]|uniref:Bacterial Pleckstrin homology domain-containing protein n=1 Tax=Dyadobacter arcticus TaxID=1078754 RepID=A0ABX0UIB7_9BACT|nr:PH domain-containing protein [Dyadobacter arcticus]NIJ52758.1 hypothetical protein [Dyadobacter arcticus]